MPEAGYAQDQLFSASPDEQCAYPMVAASSAYRYGCRCPRCHAYKQSRPMRTCEIPGCSEDRLKSRRKCSKHQAEADALKHQRGKSVEFVCQNPRCQRTYTAYESVIRRQRPELQDMWRRICQGCRDSIRGQVRNHCMNTAWALRLLLAEECDLCGKPFLSKGQKLDRVIDHDHACCPNATSCGKCIRGILHPHCNTSLGHVEAALNTLSIDRLTEYLRGATIIELSRHG